MSFLKDVILKEFLETVTRHWDPYLTSFPLHALSTLSHVVVGPILPISPDTCAKIPVHQPSDPPPAYSTFQSLLKPIATVSSSQDSWLLRLFPGTPRPLPSPWRSLCSVRQQSCWEAREKLKRGYETLQYDQNVNWRVSAPRPAASSFATQRAAEGQAAWESQQNEVLADVVATRVSYGYTFYEFVC